MRFTHQRIVFISMSGFRNSNLFESLTHIYTIICNLIVTNRQRGNLYLFAFSKFSKIPFQKFGHIFRWIGTTSILSCSVSRTYHQFITAPAHTPSHAQYGSPRTTDYKLGEYATVYLCLWPVCTIELCTEIQNTTF